MHHHSSNSRSGRHESGHRFARCERRHGEPDQGGRPHGGGGRAGLGRFFAHGDLRLVILNLIAAKPRHGYEIIKAIEEQVAGAYSPSPGVVYPTLTLLEELGYVVVNATDGTKKLHSISPQGEAFLEANRPTLDGLLARMSEAGQRHGRDQAPQIIRAVENLKLALRLRLSAGPLGPDQIDAIAAAIDAAAATVEKVQ